MEQAIKLIEKIEALREKQDKTLAELKRSLLIKALWPEAFEAGSVTSSATGNPHHNHTLTFILTRKDNISRHYDLADVPVQLWPAQVVADIGERYGNSKYKKILKEWRAKC